MGDRTLISLLFPAQNGELVKQLEGQGATVMAMDCIPRTLSRGQTYDVLSSQVYAHLGNVSRLAPETATGNGTHRPRRGRAGVNFLCGFGFAVFAMPSSSASTKTSQM